MALSAPCRHARAQGSLSASVALPQIDETTDGRGARPLLFGGWRDPCGVGAVGDGPWDVHSGDGSTVEVGVEDEEICCCVGAVVDDADEPAAVLASGSSGVR